VIGVLWRIPQVGGFTRRAPLALAVCAALALPALCRGQAPVESWYWCGFGDARLGRVREVRQTDANGLVTTDVEIHLVVTRGGDVATMDVSESWLETGEGAPVRFQGRRRLSAEERTTECAVVGDSLAVTATSSGLRSLKVVPLPGDLLFPLATERLHAARGFVPGDSYSYSCFDTDFERAGGVRVVVGGPDTLLLMGERRPLFRITTRPELYGGLEVTEWRDAEGRLWRSEVPASGLVQERTTPDEALAPPSGRDLIAGTTVASDVVIDDPRAVTRALYEVWIDGGDVSGFLPQDARQTTVGRTARGELLRVERRVPTLRTAEADAPGGPRVGGDALAGEGAAASAGPGAAYLAGNSLLQTSHPLLAAAAGRCVRDAGGDPWVGAMAIEAFVRGHVENKGFGTAFASAAEVLTSRSGDCSEHAVLLAALARAVGIPSRLVAGLVYHAGGFAHHMWVEVWVRGEWYALDPSLGATSETGVDATHIKLADSAAEGGVTADLSVAVMRSLGGLRLRVVEQTAGE
jgi:transglutaminase-like putative cysteine protease